MELTELCAVQLTYTALESLDYGGQLHGTMEGSLTGDHLEGRCG